MRVFRKRFVVVTTDKDRRGVFGGYLESWDQDKAIAVLTGAHMAIYWSSETKGVLGLASIGPQEGSRITPAVPRIELNGVTSVIDCKEEAISEWIREPWS